MRLLILAMMLILAVTIAAPAAAQTNTPTFTPTPSCPGQIVYLDGNGPGPWVAGVNGYGGAETVYRSSTDDFYHMQSVQNNAASIAVAQTTALPAYNSIYIEYTAVDTRGNFHFAYADTSSPFEGFGNSVTPTSLGNNRFYLSFGASSTGHFEIEVAAGNNVINNGYVSIDRIEICPVTIPTLTPTPTPTLDPVNADFSYSCDPCTAPALFTFSNESTGATSYSWDFGDGGSSAATSPSHVYVEAGTYTVELTATGTSGSDTYSIEISVTGAGIVGGSLFRPLQPEDEEELFEGGGADPRLDAEVVAAISAQPYDYVFAVAGGVVESITSMSDCGGGTSLITGGCTAVGYDYTRGDMFKVRVAYDTGRVIEYMVADAELFVREGQEIRAGCIIGTTAPMAVAVVGVVEIDAGGIALIRLVDAVTGEAEELLSSLIVPPRENGACNADPLTADCIGDPNFGRLQWSIGGNAQFDGDGNGITVHRGGYAESVVRLSPLLAYSFRINIEGATQGSGLLVQIGDTVEEYVVNMNTTSILLPAEVHESDRGDGSYTVRLESTGIGTFKLATNCIARDTPSTVPGTCLFNNYSFDQELANWETTGTVFAEARGEILLEDGATISQQVELYPDGASAYEYQLQVTVRARGFPDQENNDTDTIQIEWRHGGSSSWEAMSAPIPVEDFFGNTIDNVTYFDGNAIRLSAGIEIGVYTNDVVELRVQLVRAGALGLVGITEVCINDDFGTFPGATGGTTGGTTTPPFGYTCNVVTRPNTSDIGAWISFLWASLDRFFQCDLMRAINSIIDLAARTLDFLYWTQVYAQASMVRTVEWIKNDVIPWLNAHFNNIVLAQGGVGGGDSCSDIFCLLTTLINAIVSLLQPLVDAVAGVVVLLTQGLSLLFDLIGSLLNLFVVLITQIFNLFNQVRDLLSRLVDAWNTATPTPIPGVPVCNADPRSSPTCMVFWFVDNTILSGRGALIVPVIIGVAAANLILWAIKKLKDGLGEAARAA